MAKFCKNRETSGFCGRCVPFFARIRGGESQPLKNYVKKPLLFGFPGSSLGDPFLHILAVF